jgi:hypothetical protein
MLFRVHQSMLSLQSPIFAAMFTLPRPDANGDVYDGAPFVHMPDDAKDIESLLKVLYNPSYVLSSFRLSRLFDSVTLSELPYKRLDPLTPINVRRTLAMATKYEMEPLRDRIISQLQADWPNTLAEWDRLETEVAGLVREHKHGKSGMVDDLYIDEKLPEPAAAIRLAMECNVPKIMPSAVYHLSRLSIDDDWLERRKDRTDLGYARTARWDLLEAADLKLVLKLRELFTEYGFDLLYNPPKGCPSSTVCSHIWDKTCLRWQRASDPLELLRKFDETRPAGLCKLCWNEVRDDIQQCRLDLWDAICESVEVREAFRLTEPTING